MAKRAAQGAGTIRKKTVIRKGKEYTYWEARITTGRDPGTGKQVQRSFTGKTQKEVREKMQAAAVAVNTGSYVTPQKMTVGQWMDTWAADYLGGAKPATVAIYKNNIKNHIKPALGAVGLSDLRPHMVQSFINGMELSPASVRLAYKVLHMALEKAVKLEYIPKNPAAGSELPKLEQKEIHPLDDQQVAALLNAARGGDMENLITVALFTGCRLSELLGLTWGAVDFKRGTITIKHTVTTTRIDGKTYVLEQESAKTKSSLRTLPLVGSFAAYFRQVKEEQEYNKRICGNCYDYSYDGYVFVNELGKRINPNYLTSKFPEYLEQHGLQRIRLHDLRHPYVKHTTKKYNSEKQKTQTTNLSADSLGFLFLLFILRLCP